MIIAGSAVTVDKALPKTAEEIAKDEHCEELNKSEVQLFKEEAERQASETPSEDGSTGGDSDEEKKPDVSEDKSSEAQGLDPDKDTKGKGFKDFLARLKISGAAAVGYHQNTALAGIGDNAVVEATTGDVSVTSLIKDAITITSTSSITLTDNFKKQMDDLPKTFGLGGAVAFSFLNNNSKAYIGKAAQVDAGGAVNVTSTTNVPWGWEQKYINFQAISDLGDTAAWSDDTLTQLKNVLAVFNFGLAMKNYFGIQTMFNSWAQSTGGSSGFGGQMAVNIQFIMNQSHAYIDEGALINQSLVRNGSQDVLVAASSDVMRVNLAGAIPVIKLTDLFNFNGTKGAAGGSLNILTVAYYNNVSAKILSGAVVYGDTVSVLADNTVMNVSIAPFVGAADGLCLKWRSLCKRYCK